MINKDMKAIIHPRQRLVGVLVIVTLIIGAVIGTSAVYGLHQGGGTSKTGGCANTHNICTNNGFGWTLYKVDGSSGQPDSFSVDSWAGVSPQCKVEGSIYIFEVAGKAKRGGGIWTRAYPMNVVWPPYGPGTGYWETHYTGDTYDTVHSRYLNNLGGSTNRWDGNNHDLEWFCYSDNPAWTMTVATTVDRSIVEPGELITWTHKVTNAGPNKTNKDITWHYQNRGDWANTAGSDWTLGSGSPGGTSNTNLSTYLVQQSDIGKKICRATSANPSSNTGAGWIESDSKCVTVGTRPKIHILGGDLLVGNTFNGMNGVGKADVNTGTSLRILDPKNLSVLNMFGSWVEYGIFATGTVTGTGSGSAFASNTGLLSPTQCEYSNLTFVNATTSNPQTSCSASSTLGGYSTGNTITGIAANFPVTAGTTPVYNDVLPNPQGLYTSNNRSDPITLGARTIAKNEWVVINAPNADVIISGDIKYDNSPLQSVYNIPQLVIIAKDIYINSNVQQVDAWLIAQGTQAAGTGILDTCHISTDYKTALTTSLCNAPLQVNGPVMSQKLWLRRTGGSDIAGTASEVFNLRPDAYLWAYGRSSVSGRVQTVYTQELPPRF
jgi:hypothetical protein